jgi:hypothetical protein
MSDNAEGAQYRVKELSLIGNETLIEGTLIGAGTKYPFDGLPGGNLEPMNAAAEAKFIEAKAATKAASAVLESTYGDKTGGTDVAALNALIVAAVKTAQADQLAENEELKARLVELEARLNQKPATAAGGAEHGPSLG